MKKNTLQFLEEILTKRTAMQYADELFQKEKEERTVTVMDKYGAIEQKIVPYEEFMWNVWGGKKNDTIAKQVQASMCSKINRYAKAAEIFAGFYDNGGVFVLDKREKVVYLLYEKHDLKQAEGTGVTLYVHYNPMEVDVIEVCSPSDFVFNDFKKERYDFSQDEDLIIKECDKLIAEGKRAEGLKK